MKLATKHFFLFVLIVLKATSYAQVNQRITVLPPAPSAAALQKYIDYPVSIYTGVPDISIPIYEIVSGGMKLPISVSYHASGIKVGDKSYPVGLGWTLNAGGRVSRTIRNKLDENFYSFPPTPLPSYYSSPNLSSQRLILDDLNNRDIEPDVFSFSLGLSSKPSGRFIFDGQKKNLENGVLSSPMFLPKSNMKFSYSPKQTVGSYTFGINTINLIDEEGVSYNFGEGIDSKEANISVPGEPTSSWLLTSVLPVSKNETDQIRLAYSNGNTVITTSYFGSMVVLDSCSEHLSYIDDERNQYNQFLYVQPEPGHFAYINNPDISGWRFNNSRTDHYRVKNIETISFNGGKVTFTYNSSSNMLQSITVSDQQNVLIKQANFFYSNFANFTEEIKLDSITMTGSDLIRDQTYRFSYNESVHVSHNPLSQDFWGYFNGAYNSSLLPIWNNVSTFSLDDSDHHPGPSAPPTHKLISIGYANRDADEIPMKRFCLEKITYPTGGTSIYEMEGNRYLNPITQELTVVGGLRVKKIISRAAVGSPAIIKNFVYGPGGNGAGVAINVPSYDDFVTENAILFDNGGSPGMGWARERTFSSSPNADLSYADGSTVYYEFVDEFLTNENADTLGKTSYRYEIPLQSLNDNYLDPYGAPIANSKRVRLFSGYNFPYLVERKTFAKDAANYRPISSSKYFYTGSIPFESEAGDTKKIKYNPKYQYVVRRGPASSYYDTHYLDVTAVFTMDEESAINNLTYKIQQEVSTSYINKFNQVDSLVQQTQYEYLSDRHGFPTSTTTETSDGKKYIAQNRYPLDFVGLQGSDPVSLGIKNLQQLNLVSQPIENITELWKNTLNLGVIKASLTTYQSDKANPKKIFATEFATPSTTFQPSTVLNGVFSMGNAYQEKINFVYDQNGRLLQQNRISEPGTCYLWAYNGSYPVIEVNNADYPTVEGILGGSAAVNSLYTSNPDKATIDGIAATLRSQLPFANITSFTYKPLVGMTSQTDAKGMTTYYEYDAFGRLKFVKDQNNNIVKSNLYHYKN